MSAFNPLDHPICYAYPLRIAESSWLEHVPFGMLLIELLRPRTVIELGTHYGISYCAFCQAVKALETDTRCYAVDTWQGDGHSGAYGPEVLAGLREHHDPLYGGFSQLVQSTFEDALPYFEDGSIDLLHIDGYHTYEAVRHDFETWLPKMSRRGVVLLHDINVREREFGVWRLWDELTERYPHFAFSHEHGLGLLALGEIDEPLRTFLQTPQEDLPELREFFYQLGQRLATRLQVERQVWHYTEQIGIRDRAVHQLTTQVADREQAVQALTAQGLKKDTHARSLQDELSRQVAAAPEPLSDPARRDSAEDEQRTQALEIELAGLRTLFYDAHQRLLLQDEDTAQIRARVELLRQAIIDKDRHIGNLDALLAASELERRRLFEQLHGIQSRASWQLLERAWRAQLRVAPPGSPQGKLWMATARLARGGLRLGRADGTHAGAHPDRSGPDGTEGDRVRPANGAGIAPLVAATLARDGHQQDEYTTWRAAFEPGPQELAAQRARAAQLPRRPLISVVTPVFNPPPRILRETIASVVAQTYDHWELCLVDGGSTDPAVRAVLAEFAAGDARIRVRYLEHNLGIADNTNEAARLAGGEFLAFLDHDDLLAPQALFAVAEAVGTDPGADLVYFDEDKVSEDSAARSEPFFKPDWSPELLLSANYLMHSVIRRELFLALDGLDPSMSGAQDWDLALRCAERTDAILHVPQVLYHWRQMVGSTAATFTAKPYVFENQLRCVAAHLQRRGLADATARFERLGVLRASWPVRGARVSIVIPTRDKVGLLRACLSSLLRRTAYPDYEIILVDNESREAATRAYYAELAADPRVRIVDYPGRFNYSAANNLGARHATGELLLFLNNDIEILDPDWLEELVRWAERPDIGVAGTKLLYPDGRIQHAGVIVGMEGHASHIFWGAPERYGGIFGSSEWYRDYMAVTGACMMMRRSLFEEIGRFDETYELAFSDIEICLRADGAGYRNVYTPFARLRHHEGGSRGQHIPARDVLRGFEQMRDVVAAGDPYYNPNLSYAGRIPRLVQRDEESRTARLRRVCGLANIEVRTR